MVRGKLVIYEVCDILVAMQEQPPRRSIDAEVSDIDEALESEPREVSRLFRKLPHELWKRHFEGLERIAADNAGADAETIAAKKSEYLSTLLEARRLGLEEYKSNDTFFSENISEGQLGGRLQELLDSPEDLLGSGQTARVKRLLLRGGSTAAVKYLLTPTQKTLSAEGEHDMLYEVETITRIEAEEKKFNAGRRIRVPHPYFFYKSDRLQCYGMQEIKGMTIDELFDENTPNTIELTDRRETVLHALREKYASSAERNELYAELESFAHAMHEVCLHGDVKLGNVMVDERGDIYLIDFGQSVDMNLMSENTREQFENLQNDERKQLVTCLGVLLHKALPP